LTRQVLQNLADVQVIDLQFVEHHQFERCLQVASMIFVPGGNTYILNFRLHQNGLMESLRRAVLQKHVPYVGISAGTLVSGANILTSNDLNACGCTVFTGLQLAPYNFCAHFPPEDSPDRQGKVDRIMAYHEFHQNPVLALEDGAHVWVNNGTARLDSGNAWFYEKGRDPVKVFTGVAL
jgi:dipeptidase E